MPDLVNPEFNDGKKLHIIWKDELCASCLNVGNCPLLQAIYQNTILSHSGIHISNCDAYEPDVLSDYYIPPYDPDDPDAMDAERIRFVNIEAYKQQVETLNELLSKAMSSLGVKSTDV